MICEDCGEEVAVHGTECWSRDTSYDDESEGR